MTGIGAEEHELVCAKAVFSGSRVGANPTRLARSVSGIVKNGDNPHPAGSLRR